MKRAMLGLAVTCFATGAWADETHMKTGQYQVTITRTMDGNPVGRPTTRTSCVRPEDVKSNDELVKSFQERQHGHDCKISDVALSGNKLTWKTSCGPMGSGDGTITLVDGGYDGVINMTMQMGPNGKHTMQIQMAGRRVGDCK